MQINRKVRSLLLSVLVTLPMFSGAQVKTIESPYTYSGLGQFNYQGFVGQRAMGRIGRSMREEGTFSFTNPASYSALRLTDYEFAGSYTYVNQSTSNQQRVYTDGVFEYVAMGVPVYKDKVGMAFGMIPYTNTGYVLTEDAVEDGNDITYTYTGAGSINRFYFGIGAEIVSGLSVGMNAEYDFGNVHHNTDKKYIDNGDVLSIQDLENTEYRGIGLTGGVQYYVQNDNDLKFVIGGTYNLGRKLGARNSRLVRTYNSLGVFVVDTLQNTSFDKVDLSIPMGYGAGLQLGKTDHWGIGMEYSTQGWSQFTDLSGNNSFNNMTTYSFGLFYQPIHASDVLEGTGGQLGHYLKKVRYTAGVRYEEGYFSIRGNAINELGISFGLGLPMTTKKVLATGRVSIVSRLNITAEYIRRGSTNNNLIQEDIYKVSVGLNFNDKWFIKRKFQ